MEGCASGPLRSILSHRVNRQRCFALFCLKLARRLRARDDSRYGRFSHHHVDHGSGGTAFSP